MLNWCCIHIKSDLCAYNFLAVPQVICLVSQLIHLKINRCGLAILNFPTLHASKIHEVRQTCVVRILG